jgi:hypothetical protein
VKKEPHLKMSMPTTTPDKDFGVAFLAIAVVLVLFIVAFSIPR